MSFAIGIVGLPNVGKSTLFEAITKKQVPRQNYPFCTIDPNIGVVAVPDKRVDALFALTNSAKKIYTTIEFVDIAGLVQGANKGEGLGNKFLANIREVDAIVYILRAFKNEEIINTQGKIDPLSEKEILDAELILKDLETIAKIIENLKKDSKTGDKKIIKNLEFFEQIKSFLEKGEILAEKEWSEEEKSIFKQYQLLSMKPRIYLLNSSETEIEKSVLEIFKKNNWPFLIIDLETELQASSFSEEERASLGLSKQSGLDLLIKKSYELLDLITFFTTTGKEETRAWTLKRGLKAPQAGAIVHTDFEKYFIRAEVIFWKDLKDAGGFKEAREQGLIRTEGKDYTVQDGDTIEIKHGA